MVTSLWMSRRPLSVRNALTTPFVTVRLNRAFSGVPIAKTASPTLSVGEVPTGAGR
jgi:hypothetical protein